MIGKRGLWAVLAAVGVIGAGFGCWYLYVYGATKRADRCHVRQAQTYAVHAYAAGLRVMGETNAAERFDGLAQSCRCPHGGTYATGDGAAPPSCSKHGVLPAADLVRHLSRIATDTPINKHERSMSAFALGIQMTESNGGRVVPEAQGWFMHAAVLGFDPFGVWQNPMTTLEVRRVMARGGIVEGPAPVSVPVPGTNAQEQIRSLMRLREYGLISDQLYLSKVEEIDRARHPRTP